MRGVSIFKGLIEYAPFIVWSLKQSDKFFFMKRKERREEGKENGRMEKRKRDRDTEIQGERRRTGWEQKWGAMLSWARGHRSDESPGGEGREARGVIELACFGDPGFLWGLGMKHTLFACALFAELPLRSAIRHILCVLSPWGSSSASVLQRFRGKLEWNEICFTESVLHRKYSVLPRKCSGHLVFTYLALATLWRELRDRARICNPALPLNVWVIWGKLLNFSELWFPSL